MPDSALNNTLNAFPRFSGSGVREWRSNIRQAIGYHKNGMLPVLDGEPSPASTGSNTAAGNAWNKNNVHLYSLLFFANEGSARTTIRAHEGTSAQGSLGDDAAAWAAACAFRRKHQGGPSFVPRAALEHGQAPGVGSNGLLLSNGRNLTSFEGYGGDVP